MNQFDAADTDEQFREEGLPLPETIAKSASRETTPIQCPSSQPDNDDCAIIGVVGGTADAPRIQYLEETRPITDALRDKIAPLKPTEILRIAGPCVESQCKHFDGQHCRLAQGIVKKLPPVVSQPPLCHVRATCRWWIQEGVSACV